MLKSKFVSYISLEKGYSPHTLTAYQHDLNSLDTYLKETENISLFSPETITQIRHRRIRAWMGVLINQNLSARTVARKLSSVKAYFHYLQKTGVIEQNPAKALKIPSFEKKLPAFLKESETVALFEELDFSEGFEGARDRCILELLYGCGLRRSELIGLQEADIDLHERSLIVMGKGQKQRILPFGKAVADSMAQYVHHAKSQGVSLSKAFFVRPNGLPLYPKLVYRLVQKYLSQISSLHQRSPHVLRHTFATHLLDKGAELNAIKELLGHESLAATQVYTHNSISKLKSIHKQAHPRAEKK